MIRITHSEHRSYRKLIWICYLLPTFNFSLLDCIRLDEVSPKLARDDPASLFISKATEMNWQVAEVESSFNEYVNTEAGFEPYVGVFA